MESIIKTFKDNHISWPFQDLSQNEYYSFIENTDSHYHYVSTKFFYEYKFNDI